MSFAQVKAHEASAGTAKAATRKHMAPTQTGNQDSSTEAAQLPIIQFRLAIGAVNDPLEREADAVADQVMRMPLSSASFSGASSQSPIAVQRKCAQCAQEEDEAKVQRKVDGNRGEGEGFATATLSRQIQSTRGGGHALNRPTQRLMETGFGRDFSHVRIHTGDYASQMNRDLQAHAFTVGSDIYFNAGRYAPESTNGRHLLAHELAHVVQQSQNLHRKPLIQRVCDTAAYDARVAQVQALPLFVSIPAHADAIYTPAQAQTLANTIMTDARSRDNCMYYADKLHLLFSTAESPPAAISAAFGPIMAQAATDEATRLATPFGSANRLYEENISGDAARVYQNQAGQGGITYQIDRRDPANVVIKVKVFPSGDPTATANLIATEDAIEKRASVLGYTVDLEFVSAAGADVFQVGVDPGAWPTSGNWVKGPDTSAHELHHLLGLPDRYNYIDSHSGNARMYIANRIHWFNEEFRRAPSPLVGRSFMGGGRLVTDQDICEAMHAPDMAACLASRLTLRQPSISTRDATHARVSRIIEILENTGTTEAERTHVRSQGTAAMGANFVEATVLAQLRLLVGELSTADIQMENASGTECESQSLTFTDRPHAFIVCPTFSGLTAAQKAHQFVRAAAQLSSIDATLANELGQFIELVYDSTTAPAVQPASPPAAQLHPTSVLLGAGAGTDSLALLELQQRLYTFGPRTPGGISIPIPLQLALGVYGFPDRGAVGGAVGLGTDLRLATLPPSSPGAFGINLGAGFTAGATNIGTPTGSQAELGAYGRAGVYLDTSQFRITPQYQFNYLRNLGAGTDTQIHAFLLQLGYSF